MHWPGSPVHGENHSKARLAGHHLRVGLGGSLERHGLDHGGDSAEHAEFQRGVSGRWRTGQRALDPLSEPGTGTASTLCNEAQAPTAELAATPPSIKKSAPTTYAESSDAR